MKRGKRRASGKTRARQVLRDQPEKIKASILAMVEYPFRVIKCQFGHLKAHYRGIVKTTGQFAGDVCTVESVDGAQANYAWAAGIIAPATGANARSSKARHA